MQLELKFNGKSKVRNKELLNKKKKRRRMEKEPMRFKEKKLLLYQQISAQWFRKQQAFFDTTFSIIDPLTALNHLSKLKPAQEALKPVNGKTTWATIAQFL